MFLVYVSVSVYLCVCHVRESPRPPFYDHETDAIHEYEKGSYEGNGQVRKYKEKEETSTNTSNSVTGEVHSV